MMNDYGYPLSSGVSDFRNINQEATWICCCTLFVEYTADLQLRQPSIDSWIPIPTFLKGTEITVKGINKYHSQENIMTKSSKFDVLMRDITSGTLTDQQDELVSRMEEVLEEEEMGSMDEMINDIRDYLTSKNKLDAYLKEGVMQLPLELVFSWFSTTIKKRKESSKN
jgi:hypothetical protein